MKQNHSSLSILGNFNILNHESGICNIINESKIKIFGNDLNDKNIEEFKTFVRNLYSIYYLMKRKFSHIERTSGERYFEHLKEVVKNVFDLPHPNTDKIFIAIAHDSIEDTNKTFESINEDYGYRVALGVKAISKKPWEDYLENKNNKSEDAIKDAKKIRNHEYFSHMNSFESMELHINSIAKSKGIELNLKELNEITQNTLDVKFADRIHNLSTQWDPKNLEKVRRKVDETTKYFLKVANDENIEAYIKLKALILELEIRLENAPEKIEKIINR